MTVLGNRFELLDRLGAGGMAEVYRARDRRLGREVAIKLLNARCSGDPGLIERFRQESAALAQLSHPNIVMLFDTGETDDGRFYLVMERLRGEGLNEVFRRLRQGRETMSWRRLVRMVRQVCLALQAAHARQIVHRDIKPSNLFRLEDSPEGEDTIKILDFGIAKFVAGSGSERGTPQPALTESGLFVGTAHYAAPEAIEPDLLGPVDGRADVYALGILLYQAIAGSVPHEGQPNSMVLSKTANEEPPPLRSRAPQVPAAIEAVVMRAIARRPQDRFASVRELAEAVLAVGDEAMSVPLRSGGPVRLLRQGSSDRGAPGPDAGSADDASNLAAAGEGAHGDGPGSASAGSPGRPPVRMLQWSPKGLLTFIGDVAGRGGPRRSGAPPGAGPVAEAERGAAHGTTPGGAKTTTLDGAPTRAIAVAPPENVPRTGANGSRRPGPGGVRSTLSKAESAGASVPMGPLPAQSSIAGTIGDVASGVTEPTPTGGPPIGMLVLGAALVAITVAAWWAMPGQPEQGLATPVIFESGPEPAAAAMESPLRSSPPASAPAPAEVEATVAPAPDRAPPTDPEAVLRVEAQVNQLLRSFQEVVNACAEGHVLAGAGTYTLAVTLEAVPLQRDLVITEVRRSRASHRALPRPARNCVLERLRKLRIEPSTVPVTMTREFSPE